MLRTEFGIKKGLNLATWETMKTILILLVSIVVLLTETTTDAQQPNIPRIGFLLRRGVPTPTNPDPLAKAFIQGLREQGYFDGQNIEIELRYAGGRADRLQPLVAELLRLKVAVLVLPGTLAIKIAKQATQTTPIVIVTQLDPVAAGLVDSLARPGGNITGLTRLTSELSGKRLELLKETAPRISRVGILDGSTNPQANIQEYESAARAFNITLQSLRFTCPKPDFETALQLAATEGVNALITIRDPLTASCPKRIADLAKKYRLPSMNEDSPYVEAGGLMSYAANDADQFRRAAWYVDKILKGAKPADLPVEQPTKFELVINLKTAKRIGLIIPPNVLARADRVIK